jgi:hypothetical protein
LFCILGAFLAGFSQDKSFDLSKYKFPDYKRHELELNFNSSGYSWDRSYDVSLNDGFGNTKKDGWMASASNSNLNLSYSYNSLTRKSVDYLHSTISGNYAYSMNDNYLRKEKNFQPEVSWNFSRSKDYYLSENKFFLEGFLNTQLSFKNTKKTIDNDVDLNNRYKNFNIAVGVGAGYGRKENVSDLWQAYYILENLKEQGSLDRDLEEKDIFEFANLASRLKNKRFFDFRLRKIAELQALDSLLHQQGLIKDSDISYFSTLNDYWNFAGFADRESGSVLKFWFSPEYWWHSGKLMNDSVVNTSTTYLRSQLSFESNKQLNLFWERIIKVELSNLTLADQSNENITNNPKNLLFSSLEIGYRFYPNTRTGLQASIGYIGREESTGPYESPDLPSKFWNNEIYGRCSGVYYISPQLQINANVFLSHSFEKFNNGDFERLHYNLGLRYAIF